MMGKRKWFFMLLLLSVMFSAVAGNKPVGVWAGYDSPRLLELISATVFNPQWSADKPVTIPFTGREFDKVSAVVYLHGGNTIRFKEFKPAVISQLEKFVSDGGTFIIVIDGGSAGKLTVGNMAKLLGSKNITNLTGKADILDETWSECGKNPDVYEHMLAPKVTDPQTGKLINVKLAALSGLVTAKPVIGNASGNLVTVNKFGKGKVYFINVRLSSSYTSYFQHYHARANAAWEQYLPFAKMIHSIIMETEPALSKEKRELWDPQPLGPKASEAVIKPRKPIPLVSARRFTKLDGNDLPLVIDGKPQALLLVRRTGDRGAFETLNDLVFKMSGTRLPLPSVRAVGEKDGAWTWRKNKYPTRIVFDTSEHVSIKAQGNQITISAPHAQMGIQTFMREYLGYRMLWPGKEGEVFNKSANIKITASELYDKSPIRQRTLRNGLSCGLYPWKMPDGKVVQVHARPGMSKGCDILGLDVREVIKMRSGHGAWGMVQRLGGSLRYGGGANFYSWGKRYGKSRPELLALQFETVRKMKTKHIRICKSNPETIKTAVKEALENLKLPKYKDVEYYRFSPSDGGYDIMCMCENCRKWDPTDAPLVTRRFFLGRNRPVYRYPSMTDRVLRFTCEAARELQKHKPGMKVAYLAYAGYLAPPQYYHNVPENILVTFVGGEYFNPVNRERDRKYWSYWSGVARELCWRPNFLGGGSGMPLMYFREMAKDLKHFAATGMVGGDFDTLPHHWSTNALNYYVLARLLWDPALDVDSIVDDFCRSGFGNAADEMKKYYAHCEKLTVKYIKLGGESVKDLEDLTVVPTSGFGKFCHAFTQNDFNILEAIIRDAKSKVGADSPELRRIEFVETGLIFFKKNREFAMKYWNTPAKERKKLIPEIDKLVAEWKVMFAKYPFAINLTSLASSYFYTFFRNCRWKPIHQYAK